MAEEGNANGNSSGEGDTGAQDQQQGQDKGGQQQAGGGEGRQAGAAKTVLDSAAEGTDGEGAEGKAPVKATWPDDWREQMAAGDEKELKRLQRCTPPLTMRKSQRALEQKLSSGVFKKAIGPDATPEHNAAWRQEQGILEQHEEYELK